MPFVIIFNLAEIQKRDGHYYKFICSPRLKEKTWEITN